MTVYNSFALVEVATEISRGQDPDTHLQESVRHQGSREQGDSASASQPLGQYLSHTAKDFQWAVNSIFLGGDTGVKDFKSEEDGGTKGCYLKRIYALKNEQNSLGFLKFLLSVKSVCTCRSMQLLKNTILTISFFSLQNQKPGISTTKQGNCFKI